MKDLTGVKLYSNELHPMEKKTLIFHPDINIHKTNNEYTKKIYFILSDVYEVKSLEWYIRHPMAKPHVLYLNWMENTIGKNIVIIQKIQYILKLFVLYWAHLNRVKICYVVHNKCPHNIDKRSKIYQKAAKNFMSRALQIADKIIELCIFTENYINSEFGLHDVRTKTALVPLGKYTKYECDLQKYREKYKINQNEIIFSFIGKIDKYKNIDIILEAFYKSGVKAKILLVGQINPKYKNIIENLILDDNVITDFNFISDKDMSGLLQISDAILLPYENTSINSSIMINAFSNGTTVIGTDIGMLQEYDNELVYKYSYTNRYEHINALSEAMKEAAHDGKIHLQQKGKKLEEIMNIDNNWNIVRKALLDACN